MQSLLWEGPTIRIFPVAAPGAEIMRMVGPSLELIDLVNGLHEGLFLFTEFCFPSQQGCTAGHFPPPFILDARIFITDILRYQSHETE